MPLSAEDRRLARLLYHKVSSGEVQPDDETTSLFQGAEQAEPGIFSDMRSAWADYRSGQSLGAENAKRATTFGAALPGSFKKVIGDPQGAQRELGGNVPIDLSESDNFLAQMGGQVLEVLPGINTLVRTPMEGSDQNPVPNPLGGRYGAIGGAGDVTAQAAAPLTRFVAETAGLSAAGVPPTVAMGIASGIEGGIPTPFLLPDDEGDFITERDLQNTGRIAVDAATGGIMNRFAGKILGKTPIGQATKKQVAQLVASDIGLGIPSAYASRAADTANVRGEGDIILGPAGQKGSLGFSTPTAEDIAIQTIAPLVSTGVHRAMAGREPKAAPEVYKITQPAENNAPPLELPPDAPGGGSAMREGIRSALSGGDPRAFRQALVTSFPDGKVMVERDGAPAEARIDGGAIVYDDGFSEPIHTALDRIKFPDEQKATPPGGEAPAAARRTDKDGNIYTTVTQDDIAAIPEDQQPVKKSQKVETLAAGMQREITHFTAPDGTEYVRHRILGPKPSRGGERPIQGERFERLDVRGLDPKKAAPIAPQPFGADSMVGPRTSISDGALVETVSLTDDVPPQLVPKRRKSVPVERAGQRYVETHEDLVVNPNDPKEQPRWRKVTSRLLDAGGKPVKGDAEVRYERIIETAKDIAAKKAAGAPDDEGGEGDMLGEGGDIPPPPPVPDGPLVPPAAAPETDMLTPPPPPAVEPTTGTQFGSTAERVAAAAKRRPSIPVLDAGDEMSIPVPGFGPLKGRYVLVNLDDAVPSHDPNDFSPRPERRIGNSKSRNYGDPAVKAETMTGAQEFDGSRILVPGSINDMGVSVIAPDGEILGGNGRDMMEKRSRSTAPDRYNKFVEDMKAKATRFGLDPNAVGENTKIAFMVDETPENEVNLIERLNAPATKQRSAEDRGRDVAPALKPEHLDSIVIDDDQTLNQVIKAGGADVINRLVRDGVIGGNEKLSLVDSDGNITGDGVSFLEGMISSAAYPSDAAQGVMKNNAKLRQLAERAATAVVYTRQGVANKSLPEFADLSTRMGRVFERVIDTQKVNGGEQQTMLGGDGDVIDNALVGLFKEAMAQKGGVKNFGPIIRELPKMLSDFTVDAGEIDFVGGKEVTPEAFAGVIDKVRENLFFEPRMKDMREARSAWTEKLPTIKDATVRGQYDALIDATNRAELELKAERTGTPIPARNDTHIGGLIDELKRRFKTDEGYAIEEGGGGKRPGAPEGKSGKKRKGTDGGGRGVEPAREAGDAAAGEGGAPVGDAPPKGVVDATVRPPVKLTVGKGKFTIEFATPLDKAVYMSQVPSFKSRPDRAEISNFLRMNGISEEEAKANHSRMSLEIDRKLKAAKLGQGEKKLSVSETSKKKDAIVAPETDSDTPSFSMKGDGEESTNLVPVYHYSDHVIDGFKDSPSGTWFTDNDMGYKGRSGDRGAVRNPAYIDVGSLRLANEKQARDAGMYRGQNSGWVEKLKAQGFDGVRMKVDGDTNYNIFDKSKISDPDTPVFSVKPESEETADEMWARVEREIEDAKKQLDTFVAKNDGKPFSIDVTDRLNAMVTKNPRGEWQATFMDKDGPVSDTRRASYKALVEDLQKQYNVDLDTAQFDNYDPSFSMKGDALDNELLYGKNPVWYSRLERAIESSKQEKMSIDQLDALASKNVDSEEREWTGFNDWLAEARANSVKSISKERVMEFLQDNRVEVEEVVNSTRRAGIGLKLLDTLGKNKDLERDFEFSEWTEGGLAAALKGPRRDEIIDAVRAKGLGGHIDEYLKALDEGNPKYQQYVLGGGDNYKELLLTLPNAKPSYEGPHFNEPNILAHVRFDERTDTDGARTLFIQEIQSDWHQTGKKGKYVPKMTAAEINRLKSALEKLNEQILELGDEKDSLIRQARRMYADKFNVPYSSVTNIMGVDFLRSLNDSKTAYYDKITDSIRKKENEYFDTEERLGGGFDSGEVPNAPFKGDRWAKLAMRRMVRWAAENGFDRLSWTTGETQADRYNLSRRVDHLLYEKTGDDSYFLAAVKDGNRLIEKEDIPLSEVESLVGKEIAEKIRDGVGEPVPSNNNATMLEGENLSVGGDGMKGFYDKVLPKVADEIGKKFGARVGKSSVRPHGDFNPSVGVHSMDITPELRESAMGGMPLFNKKTERFPAPTKAGDIVLREEDFFGMPNEIRVGDKVRLPDGRIITVGLDAAPESLIGSTVVSRFDTPAQQDIFEQANVDIKTEQRTKRLELEKKMSSGEPDMFESLARPSQEARRAAVAGLESAVGKQWLEKMYNKPTTEVGRAAESLERTVSIVRSKLAGPEAELARLRGTNAIKQTIEEHVRSGEISREAADVGLAVIERNPKLFEHLGLMIEEPNRFFNGLYDPKKNFVMLTKMIGNSDPVVFAHELYHSAERFLHPEQRQVVLGEYAKAVKREVENTRKALAALKDNPLLRKKYEARMEFLKKAIDGKVRPGESPRDLYHLSDPSEYFAHVMSALEKGNYDRGLFAKQHYRGVFGKIVQAAKDIMRAVWERFEEFRGKEQMRRVWKDLADNMPEQSRDGFMLKQTMFRSPEEWSQFVSSPVQDEVSLSRNPVPLPADAMDVLKKLGGSEEVLRSKLPWYQRIPATLFARWDEFVSADFAKKMLMLETKYFNQQAAIRSEEMSTESFTDPSRPGKTFAGMDPEVSPTVALRFAKNASSVAEQGLSGHVKVDPVSRKTFVDRSKEGLEQILMPVQMAGAMSHWEGLMAGLRLAEEKKRGTPKKLEETVLQNGKMVTRVREYSDAEIKALTDLGKTVIPDSGGKTLADVAKQYNEWWKNTVDYMEAAGLISKQGRAVFERSDYVPFIREALDDGFNEGKSYSRIVGELVNQPNLIQRFSGSTAKIGGVLDNVLAMHQQIISAGMNNLAANDVIDFASRHGVASILTAQQVADAKRTGVIGNRKLEAAAGIVHTRRAGQDVYTKINDRMYYEAMMATNRETWGYLEGLRKLATGARRIKTDLITKNPVFPIANIIRDTGNAAALAHPSERVGAGGDPISFAIRRTLPGFIDAFKGGKTITHLRDTGAIGQGYYSHSPEQKRAMMLRRMERESGQRYKGKTPLQKVGTAAMDAWDWYLRLLEASENANRVAVYNSWKEKGAPEYVALQQANDVIDYSYRGTSNALSFFTAVTPFLHARMAGLYKIGRSFNTGETTQKYNPLRNTFVQRGLMLTAASLALKAANELRFPEEMDKIDDTIKDNYWIFPIYKDADGNLVYATIPKPFEFGTIFSTIPERLFGFAHGSDKGDVGLLKDRMAFAVTQTFAFEPNPIAGSALTQPLWEQYTNKDQFTGRPIVQDGLKDVGASEQYGMNTSMTARTFGKAAEKIVGDQSPVASPARIEAFIDGYFSQLGMYALGMSDMAFGGLMSDVEPPAKKGIGVDPITQGIIHRFVRTTDENSRYINEFYEALEDAQVATNTLHKMRRDGRSEDAREYAIEKRDQLRIASQLAPIQKRLAAINSQMRRIANKKDLSSVEKRKMIDDLNKKKNALARSAQTARKESEQ